MDGHTLGEIEHKEEDQDDSESAQSDTTEQDSNVCSLIHMSWLVFMNKT